MCSFKKYHSNEIVRYTIPYKLELIIDNQNSVKKG